MALDFLSSDIIFPSDSSEPKLATGVVTKLPEPVDWAFHDYYSTASEKAAMPLHSLADYCSFEPLQNNDSNSKSPTQVDHLVPPPPAQDHQQYLRAILCGALETVNNSMQDNHLTRLDKMVDTASGTKEDDWRWEDDIMSNSSAFSFPQQHQRPTLSSAASSLAPEDDDAEYPSPVYVEDPEDDLMSSGLTSLILSALPPAQPTPTLEEQRLRLSPSSRNDQVPYFYSTPSPVPAGRESQEGQGKPGIAKSTVWQNLVGRLKKNLMSPLANNKKELAEPSTTQPHLPSNPLKRFFKTRLH